jgi:hypothetical protein
MDNVFNIGTGLRRREIFTAMAMQGLISSAGGEVFNSDKAKRVLIDHAIAYADILVDELDAQAEATDAQDGEG